jgi:uncharacterized protein
MSLRFGARLFLYEFLLGAVGIGLAFLFGFWPDPKWVGDKIVVDTALFTGPVILLAWLATTSKLSELKYLKDISNFFESSVIGTYLKTGSLFSFLVLSVCAGFAEEIIFRGILQHHAGNFLTSVIFGLLHALTPFYFVIATFISFYLGWVYEHSDALLVPIIIHAAYDFAALVLYRRRLKHSDQMMA